MKDLVFGSDIDFAPLGERELKGVPGTWALYLVAHPHPSPASPAPA